MKMRRWHDGLMMAAEILLISWFSRRLAAVAVIEEASPVHERNDAEDLNALA